MKAWKGVVITTYQEEMAVLANTKEEAELLMYDRANPMGDSASGEMEVYDLIELENNMTHNHDLEINTNTEPDNNPVHEAVLFFWCERCPEHEDGCPTCEAWKQYDSMIQGGVK